MPPALEDNFGSYRMILRVAGPLILSYTSVMLMQIVDGLFLAWYSPEAVAALGPGGLSFWALVTLFNGVTGYTSTFVAQYQGAGRTQRIGPAVWQGIYLGLVSGFFLIFLAPLAGLIFSSLGHSPRIAELEAGYFAVCCLGGPAFVLGPALGGFFSGRGETGRLMVVQLIGTAVNAFLDWALIFGKLGFPELGIRGAAWATVIGHAVSVFILAVLFLLPGYQRRFNTWHGRGLDWSLLGRLIRYGWPAGGRMFMEILTWAFFVIFIGRVDDASLASTSIAFRINTVAFFPIIGLGITASVLVGQAQGAFRPDLGWRVGWRTLAVAEAWMLVAAALFVLVPEFLVQLFLDPATAGPDQASQITQLGSLLLRFVAIYSLLDACNVVLISALEGAGDTRWTAAASVTAHLSFLGVLWVLDHLGAGTLALWSTATVFVMCLALCWLWRFISGGWREKRVIEHLPADLEVAGVSSG